MNEVDYSLTPHLCPDGPFNSYAFNTLCVAGIVAGIHAGQKRIFLYDDVDLYPAFDVMQVLVKQGWSFTKINVKRPE